MGIGDGQLGGREKGNQRMGFSGSLRSARHKIDYPGLAHSCRKIVQRVRSWRTYLVSEFHMSWMAFQVPSFCFFQVHKYFPFSLTSLPSGPLNESS